MHRAALTGLLVVAALLALPIAEGARPLREVTVPGPGVIPAGLACAFDIGFQPSADARRTVTTFTDGRVMTVGYGDPTLTNLETGASSVQRSRFQFVDRYGPNSIAIISEGQGRININFYPGDQGPFGEVGEDGAFFAFVGHFNLTLDLDSELVTSFEFSGTATDLCQILAGE